MLYHTGSAPTPACVRWGVVECTSSRSSSSTAAVTTTDTTIANNDDTNKRTPVFL
jgi:hypothetical protein